LMSICGSINKLFTSCIYPHVAALYNFLTVIAMQRLKYKISLAYQTNRSVLYSSCNCFMHLSTLTDSSLQLGTLETAVAELGRVGLSLLLLLVLRLSPHRGGTGVRSVGGEGAETKTGPPK